MCRGLFLEIQKITGRVSLKAEAALHRVTIENTKLATTVTRQSRVIHCAQGMEVQQMHLAAPSSCCPHHKRPCPPSHRDGRGLKTGWKELQLICLPSSFASPTPLLSPSQISPFLVIFHRWRRHQVFSSAWNVHLKESTLFCSMCLC